MPADRRCRKEDLFPRRRQSRRETIPSSPRRRGTLALLAFFRGLGHSTPSCSSNLGMEADASRPRSPCRDSFCPRSARIPMVRLERLARLTMLHWQLTRRRFARRRNPVTASTLPTKPSPFPVLDATPRQELALMARILYGEGYDDHLAGHITSRQPDGTFFVNPLGLSWDELRASDIARMDGEGNHLEVPGPSHRPCNCTSCCISTATTPGLSFTTTRAGERYGPIATAYRPFTTRPVPCTGGRSPSMPPTREQ